MPKAARIAINSFKAGAYREPRVHIETNRLSVRLGMWGGVLLIGAYLFLTSPALYLTFILCSTGIVLALIDPFYALEMFLFALPLHTFMLNVAKSSSAVSPTAMLLLAMWKEIVLATLAFVVFMRRQKPAIQLAPVVGRELWMALGLMILGIPFIFLGPDLQAGLYGFRNLFEAIFVFLVVLRISPSPDRLKRFVHLLIVQATVIALWGVLQVHFYGYQYLIDFGFVDSTVSIDELQYSSIYKASTIDLQRANSIILGPNDLGQYLAVLGALVVGLLVNRSEIRKGWRSFYYVAILTITVCQFHTFSRTSWVLMGVTVLGILSDMGRVRRNVVLILILSMMLGALVYLLPSVKQYVLTTYNLTDPSAFGHYLSYLSALDQLKQNPFGHGIGTAGIRMGYGGRSGVITHVESFLLLVALEIGLPGLLVYSAFVFFVWRIIARGLGRMRQTIDVFLIHAKWLVVGTLIASILSFIPYDLMFQCYVWFFLGAAVSFCANDQPRCA